MKRELFKMIFHNKIYRDRKEISIMEKLKSFLRSNYLDVIIIALVGLDTLIITIQMIIDLETATKTQIPNIIALKYTAKSNL
jgi:hypothetical protein